MRVLLFTGKGGVGKTSVSAATALLSSRLGHRTIVMSTDAAHSLSDSFDIELGSDPEKIDENLWGYEMNVQHEIQDNWGKIRDYVTLFLRSQGLDSVVAEELSVFPGMEELFSLIKIKQLQDEEKFDTVVVDCAPTGATLRLLSFPDIARWYMQHLFGIERKAVRTLRPVAKHILSMPLPTEEVFDSAELFYKNIDEFSRILTDNTQTSVRLVMNPEKMVIKETHRAFTYLCLFGISVDSVIVNKVLPDEVRDPYLRRWKEIQSAHLKTIEESFSPIPITTVKLFDQELVGMEMLESMAGNLYQRDPTEIFYDKIPITVAIEGGAYVLSIHLPFVAKGNADLHHRGDELTITVGNRKRTILLPTSLIGKEPKEAKYAGDTLKISFGDCDE